MSRRRKGQPAPPAGQSGKDRRPGAYGRPELSRARHTAFLALTLLLPILVLAIVEGALRLARPSGGLPLFVAAELAGGGDYLIANRRVGARWFAGLDNPPGPAAEPFAAHKPDRGFRIMVLGESSAAGFPYPRNVTFSRLLGDVLRDVMPADSIEVVNLGIAATNSFAMLDLANEITEWNPDAVLIYAGHNEYYGALGAASRLSVPGGDGVVRLYLKLLRLRTVLALRNAIARVTGSGASAGGDLEAASLMEILARDRQVPEGSDRYRRGVRQFESNLEDVVRTFTSRGIPVLIASVASNLRDQPPFAAEANKRPGGAQAVFDSARAALGRGDTIAAGRMFARARDLDVVRFRAPGEFNDVIRRVASRTGAIYVPVAEAFAASSQGGIPGAELFLEHVHPNRKGYALIGRTFFQELLKTDRLARSADTTRLRPWPEYSRGMALSPFDERIAHHLTRTLTSRWPFVPVERQADYRGAYVPESFLDSLAFAVSGGERWENAKMRLAERYDQRQQFDSAAAEYEGLARDAPLFAEPLTLMASALGKAGRPDEAEVALRRAVAIHPSAPALTVLARRAFQRRSIPEAISLSEKSLGLQPNQPELLYQLALAYGMSRDLQNARSATVRLIRIQPEHPGLPELIRALGLR